MSPPVLDPPLVSSNHAPRGWYSTPVRFNAAPPGPIRNLGEVLVTPHPLQGVPCGTVVSNDPSLKLSVSLEFRRSCQNRILVQGARVVPVAGWGAVNVAVTFLTSTSPCTK